MIWHSHSFVLIPRNSLIDRVRAHLIELTLLLVFDLHLAIRLEHFERLIDRSSSALDTAHELFVLRLQDLELVDKSEVSCL